MKYIKLFEAFGDNSPYEKLAKEVMDFISEFDIDKYMSKQEQKETVDYHSNEENEPWDNAPHQEKVLKLEDVYIDELKKKFPYFNDKAVDATIGTFLEGRLGYGFPYSSEVNALRNRLEKSGITIPVKESEIVSEGNAFGAMVQQLTALRDDTMKQLSLSKEEAQELMIKTIQGLK